MSCKYGWTEDDIIQIIGEDRLNDFYQWMRGQTIMACTGKIWDYNVKSYVPDDCGPHDVIYYRHDLMRFQMGLPVID